MTGPWDGGIGEQGCSFGGQWRERKESDGVERANDHGEVRSEWWEHEVPRVGS